MRSLLRIASVCAGLLLLSIGGLAGIPGGPGDQAVRAQGGSSGAPPSACGLSLTQTAPATVRVCDEAAVTVTLQVTRPKALPLHVVFLVAKHLLMFDHLDEAKAVARDAAEALEFTEDTKVGVVSLSVQSRTEQELTNDKSKVLSAINGIRLDQVNPTVRYYDWLADAEDLLAAARSEAISPVEIIVLLSTGCPAGFESYCQRQQASSSRVQGKGVTIMGVCNPNATVPPPALPRTHCNDIRNMVSQGYYFDLRQGSRVQQRLVELEALGKAVTPKVVRLVERLAPGFSLVPGSAAAVPAAYKPTVAVNRERIAWEWRDMPPDTVLTATYRVKPLQEGPADLRLADSQATVEDNLQRVSAPYVVPTRTLLVLPCLPPTATLSPSATPEPSPTPSPTATDRPTPQASPSPVATATASPSPTARPARVYLPTLLKRLCKASASRSDIVLAVDASSSMEQAEGAGTRLQAAQDAARRFLELLALDSGDQAGLIAFNSGAQVLAALGSERSALIAAVGQIRTDRGTRIDLALDLAVAQLSGPARRLGNQQVIVLLTDGRPDQGLEQATLDAAIRARDGRELYVVGLGDEAGDELLRRLVLRPDNYVPARDPGALRAVYEGLAAQLPCPGGSVWEP